jgi:hypothetical protein
MNCIVRWLVVKPGYITTTRTQSDNQWCDGIASKPAPKHSACKIEVGNFSRQFVGINTAFSSLIIFQRAKPPTHQRIVLFFYAGAIEGKSPRECHQGALFLDDNAPAHRVIGTHMKPTFLFYQCLDHSPYSPDLTPSD